ncbi:hypothetical protein GF312_06485 [Candidatus Poribacteria bacterium]|nr:hypothetical protein [Candidatus Poribacteria bacterium]
MKNTFCIIFLTLLLTYLIITACTPTPSPDYTSSQRITVLVSYFERNSTREDMEDYRVGLTDMFITELEKIPELQVVQRKRLDAIMSEAELSEMGIVDASTAQKVGRLVGAQAIYKGSFTTFGSMMRLDGHLIRLETYEVLAAGEDTCKIDDKEIFKMVGKQASIIRDKVKANHNRLLADSFYSKGRTAEENGNPAEAVKLYQMALQYHRGHESSRKALERLSP